MGNCNQTCDADGCRFVALRAISPGEELTHSYGAKSDLNFLYTYGFAPGSNISALHLLLSASDRAVAACGSSISLDKAAPLAVEAEGINCFFTVDGRRSALKAVFQACSEALSRLSRPSLQGVLSIGRINPNEALERLGTRSPARALD